MQLFSEVQFWAHFVFLFILTAYLKITNSIQNCFQVFIFGSQRRCIIGTSVQQRFDKNHQLGIPTENEF